ncbi:uncharacterized protein LOC142345559 isoform X2 [Convolutriloba macropyga]|uniref:uncharacterized protein LOC142345559 isoform X2 n=1 Tax=Convolutriloba macropyga TaxID=536237 RepID=UPI003F51FFBC
METKSCDTFLGPDRLCVNDPIQFSTSAAQNLLRNKRVVIMGCSVQRDLYKDLVLLLQEERYLSKYENRVKGSRTVVNDNLLKGGILEELKNDPSYREVREYRKGEFHIRFYFITRAYNPIVLGFVRNIYAEFDPDIFMFNSAIWDVNRNGPPFDHAAYEQNVRYICQVLVLLFSHNCKLIWLHQPPVTPKCASGRIVLAVNQDVLKMNVLRWMYEAVCIAENITKQYGFETIDLYHLMKHRSSWIAKDGVHWASEGYRCMSLLIMHKLSVLYGVPVPSQGVEYSYPSELSQEELNKVFDEDDNDVRYLYASKVESLTVFGDSTKGGEESDGAKPLPQLLDQHNFKRVIERNNLSETVVNEEEIDGSFRTADEVEEFEKREQDRKLNIPNPMQERLRNFFSTNLSTHTKVTVAPKAHLNAFFQKSSECGGQTLGSPGVNPVKTSSNFMPSGVAFVAAGTQLEPKQKSRPSFIQSPEEVEERRKMEELKVLEKSQVLDEDLQEEKRATFLQNFNTSWQSSQSSSGLQSPMVAEGFSGGLNVKRASATLLSEQQLEDVIEATATKVCKVNRLQEMFG